MHRTNVSGNLWGLSGSVGLGPFRCAPHRAAGMHRLTKSRS
jgi:hypothetical protein